MEIDAKSGVLTLTRTVDHEIDKAIDVNIQVSDGLSTTLWRKRVPVEDINDNAPVFSEPHFSFDIPESAKRGSFVGKIEATDPDDDNEISYSFISNWGVDSFSLDPSSGIITVSANELDHEDVELYILMVSASDSGNPVMTATSTVYVNVLDVNDNIPRCSKPLYTTKIKEDLEVNSLVLKIDGVDDDSDDITQLAYRLEGSARGVFDITDNGTIITTSKLDRESKPHYSFKVKVIDSMDPKHQLESSCTVEIAVEDVNDEMPVFDSIPRANIIENSPTNTPIVTLRAFDKDEGENAEVQLLA